MWIQRTFRMKMAMQRVQRMVERKMLLEARLQVVLTKEVELEYSRERSLQPNSTSDLKSKLSHVHERDGSRSKFGPSAQLGTFPQSNGHTITSHNIIGIDTFSDLTQAYPNGWLRSVLGLADLLQAGTGCGPPSVGGSSGNNIKNIAKICIGAHHTVLLDDSSNVYSFGLGDGGQLGQGIRRSCIKPKILDKLQNLLAPMEPVIGNKGSVARGSGSTYHHQHHHQHTGYSSYIGLPMMQSAGSHVKIRDICCGRDHTLLLTSGGCVWSWGGNQRGQLGHSYFESSSVPRQVMVVANTNKLYATNSKSNKNKSQINSKSPINQHVLQSDSGSTSGSTPLPAVAVAIDWTPLKDIKIISCGGLHSVALSQSGTLFTWGSRSCLGRPVRDFNNNKNNNNNSSSSSSSSIGERDRDKQIDVEGDWIPAVPQFFAAGGFPSGKVPVAHVVCGASHTTVKCAPTVRNVRTGIELYSWGDNTYGQLGTGVAESHVMYPSRVKLPCYTNPSRYDPTLPHPSLGSLGSEGSLGSSHTTAPAHAGRADTASSRQSGSLALGAYKKKNVKIDKTTAPCSNPLSLSYSEADMNTAVLSCGGRHTLFMIKGDIWAWGWNKFSQVTGDKELLAKAKRTLDDFQRGENGNKNKNGNGNIGGTGGTGRSTEVTDTDNSFGQTNNLDRDKNSNLYNDDDDKDSEDEGASRSSSVCFGGKEEGKGSEQGEDENKDENKDKERSVSEEEDSDDDDDDDDDEEEDEEDIRARLEREQDLACVRMPLRIWKHDNQVGTLLPVNM